MNFPKIKEIATKNVHYVDVNASIDKAIELMFESDHQFVVIRDGNRFYGLTVYEIFHISRLHDDTNVPISTLPLKLLPTLEKNQSVLEALDLVQKDHEHIIVVDEKRSLYGLVTQTDLLASIDPNTLMETFTLSDFLKIRKRSRWVDRKTSTQEIFEFMERYNHDTTMVVEKRKPVGIITTKDILHLLKNRADFNQPVERYMSTPVITLSNNSTLREALSFMQHKHFKRIVAVDNEGYLIGSITQKELITITYTHWVKMVEAHQKKLQYTNRKLLEKSRRLEKSAGTDSLTGLYNRMKFLDLFLTEYTIMVQRHNALSLMVLDIDHFKVINDRYGHNIGDEVLIGVSQLLRTQLRNVDIICRWGGDEFVVLLPGATLKESRMIAEKIRYKIENLAFEMTEVSVTVSIGLTKIREGDELSLVIERADKALYLAKNSGRNSIREIP